jgi:hypothetical protein
MINLADVIFTSLSYFIIDKANTVQVLAVTDVRRVLRVSLERLVFWRTPDATDFDATDSGGPGEDSKSSIIAPSWERKQDNIIQISMENILDYF